MWIEHQVLHIVHWCQRSKKGGGGVSEAAIGGASIATCQYFMKSKRFSSPKS